LLACAVLRDGACAREGAPRQRRVEDARVAPRADVSGRDPQRYPRSVPAGSLRLAAGPGADGGLPGRDHARDCDGARSGCTRDSDRARPLRRLRSSGVDATVVSAAVTLSPIFAVPLGEARLVPCERLNRELEALFLARETDEHRNPMPSHIPQEEVFESRFNLFRWPEPCVQELRKFMLDTVAETVLQASTVSAQDFTSLKFHNHTWFHVTRHAGSFVSHNHPMASWSAVYCVRVGERPSDAPDSGLLRLFDPRPGANAYLDPANAQLHASFRMRPLEIRLEEGEVIVTGSRLLQAPNDISISPVTSVNAADIQQTGLIRVEDILGSLPQVGAEQSSGQSIAALGVATVSLRSLGSQRTLVLVGGR